jgi:hypothetical protein
MKICLYGRKVICVFTIITFLISSLATSGLVYAQVMPVAVLPGQMMSLSPIFTPTLLKGIKINPEKPFQFDFIVDTGTSGMVGESLKDESTKLVRYFLASLTIPESDLWVNLSPYEENRIIPEKFGMTEMGRDLLAQDYLLKQLTASLMHPEEELGKKFWDRVYQRAQEEYGDVDIPTEVFNKVWIVPSRAVVYEGDGVAYITESHLSVMLERDYMAQESAMSEAVFTTKPDENASITQDLIREIILPAIEKEVNEGEHFAKLRQIYSGFILASWYKKKLKNTLLNQVYADTKKTTGVDHKQEDVIDDIYGSYVDTFKKGAYNYIKEEYDAVKQKVVAHKYFSGGAYLDSAVIKTTTDAGSLGEPDGDKSKQLVVTVDLYQPKESKDFSDAAVFNSDHKEKLKDFVTKNNIQFVIAGASEISGGRAVINFLSLIGINPENSFYTYKDESKLKDLRGVYEGYTPMLAQDSMNHPGIFRYY